MISKLPRVTWLVNDSMVLNAQHKGLDKPTALRKDTIE